MVGKHSCMKREEKITSFSQNNVINRCFKRSVPSSCHETEVEDEGGQDLIQGAEKMSASKLKARHSYFSYLFF